MKNKLTHVDADGKVEMVDVGSKSETVRTAVAQGEVKMKPETLKLISEGASKKGDVLTVAKIACIQGAKRTFELIPLCHPLALSHIDIDLELDGSIPGVRITATTSVNGKTGVEMEALTEVSVASLTIYDMAKAVEKTMVIQKVRLLEKHGGQSGDVINHFPE